MKRLIFILLFTIPLFSFSQTEEDTTVYTVVEKMPEFPGGEQKLYEYLGKNMKFPQCKYNGKVTGKLFFQFIIEKDGSVSNVKPNKEENEVCKSNTTDIIKDMPKWIPGEQNGHKVRVLFRLPMNIYLR